MTRRLLLLVTLAALLAVAAPLAAAAEPQTTLPAMEQQVMCVVCRTPLSVANGPQADAQRRQILHIASRNGPS